MKKSVIYFVLILFLAGCGATTQKTYMGYKVFDVSYPVANNQILSFPITEAGVIPVENDNYKIELTGFSVGPSKEDPKKALLTWQFTLRAKKLNKIETIQIDEIAPTYVEKMVLIDTDPKIKNGLWSGSLEPIEASLTSTPWLYAEKASFYVYRFTIKAENSEPVVLNQLAWFSKPAKKSFQYTIEKINNR